MQEFVSSFEDACAKKGISTQLPDVSSFPAYLHRHLLATYQLSVILEVNNGEWKPDLADTKQYKYYPWFRINKDDAEGASGFGLSFRVYGYDASYTSLGARLACKSSDLAEFMGETFTALYKDLLA